MQDTNKLRRVLVLTQYLENYGTAYWSGTYPAPMGWKPKGGVEYVLEMPNGVEEKDAMDALAAVVEYANPCSAEKVLSARILDAGELSPEEACFESMLADGHVSEAERGFFEPVRVTWDRVQKAKALGIPVQELMP